MSELEELRAKNERLVEALRAAAKRFYNPAYGILDKDAHDECMRAIEENAGRRHSVKSPQEIQDVPVTHPESHPA
jgi:hypothetical protein